MELLFLFAGVAGTLLLGFALYVLLPSLHAIPPLQPPRTDNRRLEEQGDFRLHTCTTETLLVPVTPQAEEFLSKPRGPEAPYYRAIVVERDNLLRFAEYAVAAGLSISVRSGDEQASRVISLPEEPRCGTGQWRSSFGRRLGVMRAEMTSPRRSTRNLDSRPMDLPSRMR